MDTAVTSTSRDRTQSFRFLDLPLELRRQIYAVVLGVGGVVDLDPTNSRFIAPRFDLFLTSKQVYEEAYTTFYGIHTFRVFPTHGRFFGDNIRPLLARLPSQYRAAITSLELRLGPGWNKPPKSWTVSKRLGLGEAKSVRTLKVFVECDPSHDAFRGFRMSNPSFTDFAESLLWRIITNLPSLQLVQFDGYSYVSKHDPLMSGLLHVAKKAKMQIAWGPEAAWGMSEHVSNRQAFNNGLKSSNNNI